MQAANEAAINCCTEVFITCRPFYGVTQGRGTGRYTAEKLKTSKGNTAKSTNLKPLNTSD